jgi:hypothetical protein
MQSHLGGATDVILMSVDVLALETKTLHLYFEMFSSRSLIDNKLELWRQTAVPFHNLCIQFKHYLIQSIKDCVVLDAILNDVQHI